MVSIFDARDSDFGTQAHLIETQRYAKFHDFEHIFRNFGSFGHLRIAYGMWKFGFYEYI